MHAGLKAGLWVAVGLALLLGVSQAQAQSYHVGCGTWAMLPYADTLTMDWQFLDGSDDQPIWLFPTTADWRGLDVYRLQGGGNAIFNLAARVVTVSAQVWNLDPVFFAGGHPNCRIDMALNESLNGPWVVECLGRTPPPGQQSVTPFIVRGEAKFVHTNGGPEFGSCEEPVQAQRSVQSSGSLALAGQPPR